jgi:hypothetical protein
MISKVPRARLSSVAEEKRRPTTEWSPPSSGLVAILDAEAPRQGDEVIEIADPLAGHEQPVGLLDAALKECNGAAIARSSDRALLFTAQHNRIFEIALLTGEHRAVARLGVDNITALTLDGQGQLLALSGESGRLFRVNPANGQSSRVLNHLQARHIIDLATNDRGEIIALTERPTSIIQLDLASNTASTPVLLAGVDAASAVSWSTDGASIYAAVRVGGHQRIATVNPSTGTFSLGATIESSGEVVGLAALSSTTPGAMLTGASPNGGYFGTVVVLRGSGLAGEPGADRVFVGGVEAQVLSASTSSLTFRVPVGAGPGGIEVLSDGRKSNLVAFSLLPALADPTITQSDLENGFVSGEVLVRFAVGELSVAEAAAISNEFGFVALQYLRDHDVYRGVIGGLTHDELLGLLDTLRADPRVTLSSPNRVLVPKSDVEIHDPYFPSQVQFKPDFLNLKRGFEVYFPKMGLGTRIAVLDSGVSSLGGEIKVVDQIDYVDDTPPSVYPSGHGTEVAGIAAAADNTGICGIGVAPYAEVLSARVTRGSGLDQVLTELRAADGLLWALDRGARVINISYGEPTFVAALPCAIGGLLELRIAGAVAGGVAIVASAGNDRGGRIDYPACLPGVIAVGSYDYGGGRSDFSDRGPELDFVVKTDVVETVVPSGSGAPNCSFVGQGTSYSAPQVSGVLALLFAEEPQLSVQEARTRIINRFTRDLGLRGFDDDTGWGAIRLNTYESEDFTPRQDAVIDGGVAIRPQVTVGPSFWITGAPATLEFFANNESLGAVDILVPGRYSAPTAYTAPNRLGAAAVVDFQVELRQGPAQPQDVRTRTSHTTSRFNPIVGFGPPWNFEFDIVQDSGGRIRTWHGTGLTAVNRANSTMEMTVADSGTGESRTCNYTGNFGLVRLQIDDIFRPRYWILYSFLEKCLPYFAFHETLQQVFDLQNPASVLESVSGDCVHRAEIEFDDRNVSSVTVSRTNCVSNNYRFVLRRP